MSGYETDFYRLSMPPDDEAQFIEWWQQGIEMAEISRRLVEGRTVRPAFDV